MSVKNLWALVLLFFIFCIMLIDVCWLSAKVLKMFKITLSLFLYDYMSQRWNSMSRENAFNFIFTVLVFPITYVLLLHSALCIFLTLLLYYRIWKLNNIIKLLVISISKIEYCLKLHTDTTNLTFSAFKTYLFTFAVISELLWWLMMTRMFFSTLPHHHYKNFNSLTLHFYANRKRIH